MALSPAEAFASQLQLLAAKSLPLVERIEHQIQSGPDGNTYFSATFTLQGKPLPYHTEASTCPSTAYKYANQAIIRQISKHPQFTPKLPTYASCSNP